MEDELLYSYVLRLAEANVMPVQQFISTYMFSGLTGEQADRTLDYGSVNYIQTLAKNLGVDPVDFFLKTTLYPGLAPLIPRNEQARYVNIAFRGRKLLPNIITYIHSDVPAIKRCQLCWEEEEKEYGFGWYHRVHQMPGVSVCHKHKTKLQAMRRVNGKLIVRDSADEADEETQQDDWEYAVFAKEFLEAEFTIDGKTLRRLVRERIDSAFENSDRLRDSLVQKGLKKELNSVIGANYYVNPTAMLAVLFNCFHEVKNIPQYNDESLLLTFLMECSKEYEVLEPYRATIIKMRVKKTGEKFITTPRGFISGWREYSGDAIGEQEKYKQILKLETWGMYEPISPFKSMYGQVTVRHLLCGNQYSVRAKAILEEGSNCKCLLGITENRARDEVEYDGKYKLLSYNQDTKKLEIKAKKCGHDFKVSYRAWKKNRECRACAKENKRNAIKKIITPEYYVTTETFKKRMSELTGDEYSLEESVKTVLEPVKIRHNVCGTVFPVTPNMFTQGMRCTCVKFPFGEEFLRYVAVRSCGRYTAERDHGSHYKVTDTRTGRTIILKKLVIVQELERPTPSPKLPLEEKGEYIRRKSHLEIVEDWAKCHYSIGEVFFLDHIAKTGLTKEQNRYALESLVKKGVVQRVGRNQYLYLG